MLFFLVFNLLPFAAVNNTLAVDGDGTANLDMVIAPNVWSSSIIWSNFSYNFSLKNEVTSESGAFKNWFILSVPDKISYISNSWLWNPSRTLIHSSWNTLYFFKTSDFLVEWSSSSYNLNLKSDNDAPLSTPMDIKILWYADDNIYGRWPVPSWAPAWTLPGWVDFASGSWFTSPTDPTDLTFPDNILATTDISSLPFISESTSFTPFDITKTAPWLALIWSEVETTLTVHWNSLWALNNFHLSDVIPKNRKFVWFTQTWWVSWVSVAYNAPNNWEVTLDLSWITVPINTDLEIKYKTLALAYDINSYSWSTILLNTWSIVQDRDSSINTVTMIEEWTWFDGSSNVWVNSWTLIWEKDRNVSLAYADIAKSVDNVNPVIWDTLTYTVSVKTAKNISFTTNWSWTYIQDTLPDGMVFTGALSSTVSWTWTALTFVSSTADPSWNWDTILLWKLNSGIINADETFTIVYQTYIDGLFEWSWDTTYENTDTLVNIAELFGTIWDSWKDGEWGKTDPTIIWTNINYISGWGGPTASVSAPNPINDKRLLSVRTPDGTLYTSGWIPSEIPVWSSLEFLISMDFPYVDFLNTKVVDALPLLAWPNDKAYDFAFQTNKTQLDIDGNSVLYNTNDKSSGIADTSFNGYNLTSTGWISETPANNIEFELWSWTWNKVFAIKFKVDILETAPSPIPTDWLVPLTNLSLASFENDSSKPFNLDLEEFPFTISVPYLTLDKTSSGTNIVWGKNIDYTLEIKNTWNASAYLENIIDTLPSNLDLTSFDIKYSSGTLVPNSLITQSGSELNIIFNTGSLSPNRSVLEKNKTILINYSVNANTWFIVKDWDARINTANFDYYSSSWALSNDINNYWPIEDTASFDSGWPSITRTLISTTQSWSTWDDLEIWEEVTFETIITIPWGTYNDSIFIDQIANSYLDYVTGSLVSTSGSLILDNPAWIFSIVNNELQIDFWNIVNNDWIESTEETIIIRTTQRAKNWERTNRNTRSIFNYNSSVLNSATVSVDIIEPNIILNKSVSPLTWDAGDVLTYTVNINNTWNANAYDLVLTDLLDSSLTFVTWSLVLNAFSWSESEFLSSTGITLWELSTGTSTWITFQATINNNVAPKQSIPNRVDITFDSLDENDSINEKDYTRDSSVSVTINNVWLTHSLISTDNADTWTWRFNTSLFDLHIWEKAIYKTTVTIPESTFTWMTITQSLPVWYKFLSWSISTSSLNHSSSWIVINPDNTITYTLWDITNPWSSGNKTLDLYSEMVLTSTGWLSSGQEKWLSTLTASWQWGKSTNITTNLDIVEPNISIEKDYSISSWDSWDVAVTTITISNNGTAPAYDLSWTDLQPSDVTTTWNYFTSSWATTLAVWSSIIYTYNTTLDNTVVWWDILTWTASIMYTSAPLTNSSERSYTANDTDSIQVSVLGTLIVSLDTVEDVKIWDSSSYTIKIPIPEGTTNTLQIDDLLPTGVAIHTWSIMFSTNGPVTYSGSIQPIFTSTWAVWNLNNILNTDTNNGTTEEIIISFDTVLLNNSDNNTWDTKVHNTSVLYNGWNKKTATSSNITVIEPSINLEISNIFTQVNSLVKYTFTLTNTWTAIWYDLDLDTLLPSGITYTWSLNITNSGWVSNLVQSWLNFSMDSLPINTSNPLTFEIYGLLDGSQNIGDSLQLTGSLVYSSQTWSYAPIIWSNNDNKERNWSGWINDYSDTATTSFIYQDAILNETITIVDDNWWDFLWWENLTYTVTLTNSGNVVLTNIPVTINIPEYLSGSTFILQSVPGWSVNNYNSTWWTWNNGELSLTGISIPVWESRTIVYKIKTNTLTPDGTNINTVAHIWNSPEWAIWWMPNTNIAIISPEIIITSLISDENGWSLHIDDIVTHTHTITNSWSSIGSNLQVQILFNTGSLEYSSWSLVFASWSLINTWSIVIDNNLWTIDFVIAGIDPNIVETITFKSKVIGQIWDKISTIIKGIIDEWFTNDNDSNELSILAVPVISSWWGGWGWWGGWHSIRTIGSNSSGINNNQIIDENKVNNIITKEVLERPSKEILEKYINNIAEKKKLLEKLLSENQQEGKSWLITLPDVLPKTWTEISTRISINSNPKVDTSLPSSANFALAWSSNISLDYWKQVLPAVDRNSNKYIVLPSNGLVIPVNDVEEDTADFNNMINGREIEVNKYLQTGVVEYPKTSLNGFGEVWNKVIFWHSSYWNDDEGRYKTHFQKIIELDVWEQVWVYEKQASGEFKMFKYVTFKSYNTDKADVDVLRPGIGKNLTLFTCTPIGWITWRWIIKAKYIDEAITQLQREVYFNDVSLKNKRLISKFFTNIKKIQDTDKKEEILNKLYYRVGELLEKSTDNKKLYRLLELLKLRLSEELL